MAFVSGARQCGKTTLAKMILEEYQSGIYHNWDDIEFRKIWTREPKSTISRESTNPLIIYDEIHKAKLWKRTLKGIFDTATNDVDILVAGSARLNVYRRGSDSLLGRYYHFRLHPFSLGELLGKTPPTPEAQIRGIFAKDLTLPRHSKQLFSDLMRFGPFPEPLLSQSERKARLWRRNRLERIIREDLRDMTRTLELSQIEMLAALLPDRVGSLVGFGSLREDLEVSYNTVRRWIDWLKELYYIFEIKPYSRSISRAIRKEGKVYLWDFSQVTNEAARFENLIACALLKSCHYWSDSGEGDFDLRFLRNKEKYEIDFLITRDGLPWLPVEVKLSEEKVSPNWGKFMHALGAKRGIQVTAKANIRQLHQRDDYAVLVVSAQDFLSYLH